MDAQPPFSTIRIPNIDWILWGARALPCPTSLWTGKILRATTSPRYMALGPRGDRDHHWCVVFVRTADARFICLGGRKTRLHEGKGDLGTKTSRGTSWPNTSLTCAADKKRSPRVRIDFGGFISTAVRPVFQHVNVTAGDVPALLFGHLGFWARELGGGGGTGWNRRPQKSPRKCWGRPPLVRP